MSDDPEQREHADIIEAAFGEILQPGEVLTGWAVMATLMDADGEQRIYGLCPPEQLATTTLGLLDYGLTCERRNVQHAWDAGDTDVG